MKNAFIIYAAAICLLFAYATYIGWSVADSVGSGSWGPRGHNTYHK